MLEGVVDGQVWLDFNKRLSSSDEYRREELIKNIEFALSKLTLSELEAISYDLLTKGYMD